MGAHWNWMSLGLTSSVVQVRVCCLRGTVSASGQASGGHSAGKLWLRAFVIPPLPAMHWNWTSPGLTSPVGQVCELFTWDSKCQWRVFCWETLA